MSNQSNNIPNISIFIDPEMDVDRFCFFLKSPEWHRKRSSILNFYPKLANDIEHGKNEKEAVRDFVIDMYRRYDKKIKDVIAIANKEFSGSEPVFAALAKYMAFPRISEKSYIAIPTFLPFSPLNDNLFFFSIARIVAGREMKPFQVVFIGIHEISHFIFFEQLHVWSQKTGIALNDHSVHYFKEALTAAIMNQSEFRKFFDYPSLVGSINYPGNQELHQLFIDKNGKNENIVTFFEKEIMNNPDDYITCIDRMLLQFAAIGNVIAEKWKLWNNVSLDSEGRGKFIRKYSEPIKI